MAKNELEKPIIYCGDLNIVAEEKDIHSAKTWRDEKMPGVLDYEKTKQFRTLLAFKEPLAITNDINNL